MRVQAPEGTAITEAVGYGLRYLITPGAILDVPMVIGWTLVVVHGFGNVDVVTLPPRHPDDRPWTWRDLPRGSADS